MKATDVGTVEIWTGMPFTARARLEGIGGDLVTQASLSGISLTVYDKTADDAITYTGAPVVGTTIFDELQTWPEDATGYNFAATVPGEAFEEDGHQYRAVFEFTASSGGVFFHVRDVTTKRPAGSS